MEPDILVVGGMLLGWGLGNLCLFVTGEYMHHKKMRRTHEDYKRLRGRRK